MEYKIENDKQHKIIEAVSSYVKEGERNTEPDKVLHPHFRLANDTSAETPADSIVVMEKYYPLLKKKFMVAYPGK